MPSARRDGRRFYHPELDVLRFFAFLMVFLHHGFPHEVPFWTEMRVPSALAHIFAAIGASGAYGVDVFFVLSSYLITELLLREKETLGSLDVRSFYIRRILRIWPLYFAFLALAIVLQWVIRGQHITWSAGMAFTLLAGNWYIVFRGFPQSVIFPLWSVSIEEQFYITWPALVRRNRERTMFAIALGLLAVANATRLYLGLTHAPEEQVWCTTFVQLDSIAAGILIALLLKGRVPHWTRLLRLTLVFGGLACIATAANYFRIKSDPLTTPRIMLGYPLMTLGCVTVLLGALGATLPRAARPFIYLGRISYGLYVFHILGLLISDYAVTHQTSSLSRYAFRLLFALAATIAMAAISYRWLETPFLNLKQRFTHVLSRPGG